MKDPRLLLGPIYPLTAEQHESRTAQAKLIGAELASSPSSGEQFDAIASRMRGLPWFEFEASFVNSFAGEHRDNWLKFILAGLDLNVQNVDRFVPRREDAAQAMIKESQQWAERRLIEPWSIWTERSVQINLSNYCWSRLLSQIDFEQWMTTLDAMQSPSWLNEQALASDIREDRERLFRLLTEAPLVFDGWKPTGSVLALIATQWIFEHAVSIDTALAQPVWNGAGERAQSDTELQAFRNNELPQYLEAALGKLLDRADGAIIALHFSANVSDRLIRSEVGRSAISSTQDFDITLFAFDKLSAAIRNRDIPLTQYKRLDGVRNAAAKSWLAKKPSTRSVAMAQQPMVTRSNDYGEGGRDRAAEALPVWLAALGHVYAAELPEPGELAELWMLLESVLVARDSALRTLVNDDVQSTRTVIWMAHVLAKLKSPSGSWSETYSRLEPQRRRAQHSLRYEDHDEGCPSMILLQVGGCAVSMLTDDQESEREVLFEAIESAARRLWLTSGQDLGCNWKYLYARTVALTLDVYGTEAPECFAALCGRVSSNGWLLCASAKLMLDKGIAAELLDASAREVGVDLVAELVALKNWTAPTDIAGYPPGFDTLLEALMTRRERSFGVISKDGNRPNDLVAGSKVGCANA